MLITGKAKVLILKFALKKQQLLAKKSIYTAIT